MKLLRGEVTFYEELETMDTEHATDHLLVVPLNDMMVPIGRLFTFILALLAPQRILNIDDEGLICLVLHLSNYIVQQLHKARPFFGRH